MLVERQSARSGGGAERRAGGADQRLGARRAETRHKVAARQLAELHPEQGSAFEPDGGRRGREMLLADLARGARRKGVAAARQIGAGPRLRDRAPLGREGEVLRVVFSPLGRGRGRRGGAGAVPRWEEQRSDLQSLIPTQ